MRSGFRQRTSASLTPAKRLKFWCTGKDSNLRTSLGGTDLQSVGFNHSPTCAKKLRAMQPLRFILRTTSRWTCAIQTLKNSLSQIRETKNRACEVQREDHCTPEPFRMKCVGKTCCAA